MKNHSFKAFIVLCIAVIVGVISFGAHRVIGGVPTYAPPGVDVSPTFGDVNVGGDILLKKGKIVVGSDWVQGNQTAAIDLKGGSITNTSTYHWIDVFNSLYLWSPEHLDENEGGHLALEGSIYRLGAKDKVFISQNLGIVGQLIMKPSGTNATEVFPDDSPTFFARSDGAGLDISAKEIKLEADAVNTTGDLDVSGDTNVSGHLTANSIGRYFTRVGNNDNEVKEKSLHVPCGDDEVLISCGYTLDGDAALTLTAMPIEVDDGTKTVMGCSFNFNGFSSDYTVTGYARCFNPSSL